MSTAMNFLSNGFLKRHCNWIRIHNLRKINKILEVNISIHEHDIASSIMKRFISGSSYSNNKAIANKENKKNDSPTYIDPRPYFSFRLDESVHKDIGEGKYKPTRHPGLRNITPLMPPEEITNATSEVLKGFNKVDLVEMKKDALTLYNKIWERHVPLEQSAKDHKMKDALESVVKKEEVDPYHPEVLPEDRSRLLKQRYYLLSKKLKSVMYNYEQLDFSTQKQCVTYLFCRANAEYAAIVKVFRELQIQLPGFSPKTMMDFGSGVGTVTWALDKVWPKECEETFSIDSSVQMNILHETLLRGGDITNPLKRRPNTSHIRQYLPTSAFTKYDLVVISRSLMELDTMELRIRTIDILWKTVSSGGCLVIIEAGNVRGSELILEARKYLTEAVDAPTANLQPLLIAPCPHSMACPLMKKHPKHRLCTDGTQYFPYDEKNIRRELFSYVIFHKPGDKVKRTSLQAWPRIVQPVIRPSGFHIVRVCHKGGELQQLNVSKVRHGKVCKSVSKRCKHGDLFPVEIVTPPQNAEVKTYKQKKEEMKNIYLQKISNEFSTDKD